MEIKHKNEGMRGAFLAEDNNEIIGEMTYFWSSKDIFTIDHTGVMSSYREQGVGNKMVADAVAYARENNLSIVPVCSFARSVFDNNPEYNDVRKTD